MLRAALGDDHPFTLSCAINKANCLHDLRAASRDAEGQQRETSSGCARCSARHHPDTQVCEANLAINLRAQGGTSEEAERLQQIR